MRTFLTLVTVTLSARVLWVRAQGSYPYDEAYSGDYGDYEHHNYAYEDYSEYSDNALWDDYETTYYGTRTTNYDTGTTLVASGRPSHHSPSRYPDGTLAPSPPTSTYYSTLESAVPRVTFPQVPPQSSGYDPLAKGYDASYGSPLLPPLQENYGDSQATYGGASVPYAGHGSPLAPEVRDPSTRHEDVGFVAPRSDVAPTDINELVPPEGGDADHFERSDDYFEGRFSSGTVESLFHEEDLFGDTLEEKDIILINRQLDVPFGRVKYLDPEADLKIRVQEGHRCRVTVVDNEPITQRPGMLTPSNFSCDFTLNEVQYTHLGGRYPSSDTVKLLLRYDTQRDTFIIPFTMGVKVLYDMQLEVVTLNMPLNVDELLGTSNAIDSSNTMFAFDDDRHECKITLLHRHSDLPRYGVVISDMGDTPSGYMVPCRQFLESGVRYRHTVTPSTRLDYIPAVVELYGIDTMTLQKQEYFQFPVRIRAGKANTAPSVSYESLLLLDVNQFVMTALTPSVVTILDGETSAERLIFNVTKPLGSGEGELVSTDDQNLPVTSFYQRDVQDLKIVYKPPAEDSDVKRTFSIDFEVLDDEGLASEPFSMMIVVNPKKTKAPITMKNAGLELFEGQSRRLSSAKNLEIADEDNLEDVTLSVIGGLKHGQLLLMGAPTKIFSPADLDTGAVVYEHDGSETYTDNILVRMSDTQYAVEFLFPITIFPEDDQPPVAHVNTGFQVKKGELKEITPFLLSATDVDSDDASITYKLRDPQPKFGDVILRRPTIPSNPENWQYLNTVYEKRASTWTQRDITDGFLYYRHLGEHQTVSVMDSFHFTLADDHEPPNESEILSVVVKVLPVDDIPPELHDGCSLTLTVDEHKTTALSRSNLQYIDLDSKNRNLVYHIQPLRNVDVNDRMSPGNMVLTESPEVVVTTFTQAQINHRKISYKPPKEELGIVPRIIQFEFEIEDEAGNRLPGQTFTIFLTPVNNQPPEVHNSGIHGVHERSEVFITTEHLDVSDVDTDVDNIIFRVSQVPFYGSLLYDTLELAPGNEFTRRDLIKGFIKYANSGKDEMDKDSFRLDVTDGAHTIPVTVYIDIEPIDDEPPRLLELLPGSFGVMVKVKEGQEAAITTRVLKATDPDSEYIRLTYIINEAPRFGRILLNGVATSSFTQMAIEKGEVYYRHEGGDIGKWAITDNFTLILSDMSDDYTYGGNRIDEVMVNVTIEPIDNIAPEVFVGSSIIVDESSRAPITIDQINISDVDSTDEKVTCTITRQPTNGYIENTSPAPGYESSRRGIPVTSFTLEDISEENLNYVQSIYTKVEPREDNFVFHCTDGINRSPEVTVFIQINPFNDEFPEFFLKEFVVMEGMDIILQPPVIAAIDGDEPKDKLTFKISRKPQHGKIMQESPSGMLPIDEFTIDDINVESKIVYSHDNTETTQDHFEIELSDGNPEHVIRKEVKVKVLPEDDEAPRLTLNTGVEVDPQEAVIITDLELMAEDLDSDDKSIAFIIRKVPRFGSLQRLDHNTLTPLLNLTSGMNFTQGDIDGGIIQYRHTGIPGVRDVIKFDLTDGKNRNMDRSFYVEVNGEDNIHPHVVNKGVALPEGGRVVLNTDILSTSDLNSDDELLNFTITRAPSRGHLEVSDMPGFPITSFTQLQLAGNKISYVHQSQDEVKMDSFEFVVTDGYNSVYRTFRISISDVDNKKPVLFVGELRVREGASKLITPFELKLEDRDTEASSLRFTVTRVPLHGKVLFNRTHVTRQFTQADVEANLITYHHDGSETTRDDVHFIVTDGTHADFYVFPNTERTTRTHQRLAIRIEPVDNGLPKMSVNEGASHLSLIDDDKGSSLGFVFSTRVLHVEDPDSPPEALTYVVEEPPRHGRLVSERSSNTSIDFFTQDDIDNRKISYRLQSGVNETVDSFRVTVEDKGGNHLPAQEVTLQWSWVSLEKELFEVNETDEVIHVTLRRRGYLGETSFVTMQLANDTARVDLDLHPLYAHQVQFNPGQRSAQWRLRLEDDLSYEGVESLTLRLGHPVMTSLEYPWEASIRIRDEEDVSRVEFEVPSLQVEEEVGALELVLVRTGDLSKQMKVSCVTESEDGEESATGTVPTTVLSYSDYITRADDDKSIVTFDRDQSRAKCRVIVIDDALQEGPESFSVLLKSPRGGVLGDVIKTTITIMPDDNDVPRIFFGESQYHVDESVGSFEVTILRVGTDLSKVASVQVASKALNASQAQAGYDYIAIGRQVDFPSGVTSQVVRLTILDDLGSPSIEGPEALDLVLQVPVNAALGSPSVASVTINDSLSDLPKFEFRDDDYSGYESDGEVTTWVTRTGDLSHQAFVRCFTRQSTADVSFDFDERPNTNASLIHFQPGESERPCTVILVNDHKHEDDEVLMLQLGTPSSPSAGGALLGERNSTRVTIKDTADRSTIQFEKARVSVEEPPEGDQRTLRLGVVRGGDTSTTVAVRIHTKDGSAVSGSDYYGLSRELVFAPNVSRQEMELVILGDKTKEHREAFTVHLRPLEGSASKMDINVAKAIVYIEEMNIVADVTFPSPPVVVSLQDYDVAFVAPSPVPGYPVICVTACDRNHPDFEKTSTLCARQGINQTLSTFRWRVAAPSGYDGVVKDLKDVSSDTFFTGTRGKTLDSIYFAAGSRVQCLARAYSVEGETGLEVASEAVSVAREGGLCPPRYQDTFGADPFTAKLHYTGPKDEDKPNLIRVEVVIPHRDGMVPVISTRPLTNFELTLSRDGIRIGNHRCSNLLDFHEVRTSHGFITNETRPELQVRETEPNQHSSDLRTEPTLRFYRALDLESCLWRWVGYYTITELVTQCGGDTTTDGQVLDVVQSYVSVVVPLYVSYIFHSPVATGGWQHTDLTTHLRLSFVYDTSILWRQGIGAPATSELDGHLYPTAMKIREDGRLVVSFRTEARFRGIFVKSHQAVNQQSSVTSEEHPDLTFTLELIRSQPTYAQPEQQWQFISDFAVRDYSGKYSVNLLPCTVTEDITYSLPLLCNPRNLVAFDLQVRFQQVSDPVPEEFTLNTLFHLLRNRQLWISDLTTDYDTESDVSFYPGERIYGRVMIDPIQALGVGFHVTLEKCFVCTGVDGYVPKYNPETDEFGCVADSPNLLHNFKIIDKGAPDSVKLEYQGKAFEARLAEEETNPDVIALLNQPGADGFSLDSTPLFEVSYGRQWFVHCIYTVRSEENAARGIGKRDVSFQRQSFAAVAPPRRKRVRREEDDSPEDDGRGTNMHRLSLKPRPEGELEPGSTDKDTPFLLIPLLVAVICVVAAGAVATAVVVARRRQGKVIPPGYMTVAGNGTSACATYRTPVDPRYYHTPEDSTEV